MDRGLFQTYWSIYAGLEKNLLESSGRCLRYVKTFSVLYTFLLLLRREMFWDLMEI